MPILKYVTEFDFGTGIEPLELQSKCSIIELQP